MTSQIDILKRALERERRAKKEAEKILEEKTKELYIANEKLKKINSNLENTIQERIEEVQLMARFPEENPNPIMRFNQGAECIYANEKANYFNKRLDKHPDVYIKFHKTVLQVIQNRIKSIIEISFVNRVYRFSIVPIVGETYINVYGTDITRAKKGESKLATSERRLKAFLASVPDMMFRINKEGTFLDVKSGITDSLNLNKPIYQIIGTNIFHTQIDQKHTRKILEAIQNTIDDSEIQIIEYDHLLNNTKLFFEARIVKSGVNEAICTIRDITDKKKFDLALEDQRYFYESILNNMPIDIVVFDLDHKYLFVNPTAVKDQKMREWLIGKDDFDYCKIKNKPSSLAINRRRVFQNVIKRGEIYSVEEKLKNSKGEDEWHFRRMSPIKENKTGVTKYLMGFGLDITKLKKTQIELEKAKDLAEHSSNAKDIFLANMSHEIRTPMNAILGMSKLLEKTILDSQQKKYLFAISDATDHLLTVLNDILDFSKINSGQISLEQTDFNIELLIKSVFSTLSFKSNENGNKMYYELSPNTHLWLKGDATRIKQSLLNLVSNAIKFTKNGDIKIFVNVIDDQEHQQKIKVDVMDTGIGIVEEKLKTIFESFKQEDQSTTRKFGGTGLGLSISKSFIELMGGKIYVKSKKGVGTTFSIEIPLEKTTPKIDKNENYLNPESYNFQGIRLLIAEDNQFNQLFISEILKVHDFHFDIASNGLEACELAKKNSYELALFDIQMPEMSGIDACKMLKRELHVPYPVIALTANALKGDRDLFLNAGFDDYMSKPFAERDLLKLLIQYLGLNISKEVSEELTSTNISDSITVLSFFDYEKLLNMTNRNVEFSLKMLDDFYRLTPVSIKTFKTSYENQDLQQLRLISHKLKSSFGIIATAQLFEKLVFIEKTLKSGGTLKEIEETILAFLEESQLLMNEIEQHLSLHNDHE